MDADLAALPEDIDALKAALATERARMQEAVAERDAGAAELAVARAKASEDLALIAHQKLRIAKLERQLYGPRSERSERLIDCAWRRGRRRWRVRAAGPRRPAFRRRRTCRGP
jgi:transposase